MQRKIEELVKPNINNNNFIDVKYICNTAEKRIAKNRYRCEKVPQDVKKMKEHHKFWTIIKKLDIDLEKKCDKAYISSKLTEPDRKFVKKEMLYFISVLNKSIGNTSCIKEKSNKFKADFYSHIIARGVEYFMLILSKPLLTKDIINDYIPVWSYL